MERLDNKQGRYFFLAIFVLVFIALFKLYSPFLTNLLIAFLLFLSTQEIYFLVTKKIKSRLLSSSIMIFLILLLCFIPIFYVVVNLADMAGNIDFTKLQDFALHIKFVITNFISNFLEYLPKRISDEVISLLARLNEIDLGDVVKRALSIFTEASKSGIFFVSDVFFIIVFLFFFYYYGFMLGNYALELIPLKSSQTQEIYNEVSAVIGVVFYSSIVSMVLQGALFGVLVYFYDYNAFLFGVFYGFASLIPVVGGTLVWLPVALYELYLGNISGAIVISLYSMIVIATLADNGLKPIIITFINRVLIKTQLQINEMLIFFAIIAGIGSFGFWGIVLGPAITALFIALLRIYKSSYRDLL